MRLPTTIPVGPAQIIVAGAAITLVLVLALLASGFVCGFLWEFWNYWALSKWTYTVPYFGNIKIFEMPVLGFLGFPPFAVECWAIYILVRSLLQPSGRQWSTNEIFVTAA